MSKIRRYFITGLLVILPLYITLYFLIVLFRIIDGVWGKIINFYIKKHLGFTIPGLGVLLAIITVLVAGFLATHFLGRSLFKTVESWFLKFPIVRQVYPAVRQIVNFFVSKERTAFKKVALVEYPSKGIWSVGFVTNDGFREAQEKSGKELVHVFIGTTPTPLSGFLVLIPKDQVKFLDISIEDGIKLIVSGGILKPK